MARIVHTADWHLGARLVDCERLPEQAAFLDWLLEQLEGLRPDLLIVAGDIFDGSNPPQDALNLYYNFLARLAGRVKCQILILGGNHDSPATLHAPREILKALSIRVIASPPPQIEDALLDLGDTVVCAVPFLRERDVRTAAPAQSAEEVAAAIRAGISGYYQSLLKAAREKYGDTKCLVATGHLTTVGSIASDSERKVYVGNLGAVHARCFDGFDYIALGHIHRPQRVEGHEHVRYSGSPIPLSFDEVGGQKEIRLITTASGGGITQQSIPIPAFRALHRLTTPLADLETSLREHAVKSVNDLIPWIELTVSDGWTHPDLDHLVRDAAESLSLRILKLLAPKPAQSIDASGTPHPTRTLDELQPEQVFEERLLRAQIDLSTEEGKQLMSTFLELLGSMQEVDTNEKEVPQ